MSMIVRTLAALVVALTLTNPVMAQILTSKGTATAHFERSVSPELRDSVLRSAKLNALERYIAETNPAKQRMFDAAHDRLVASLDGFILSSTTLSETEDKRTGTYSIVVRVEINSGRFENALADASGSSPTRGDGAQIAVVFVSRTPLSIKSFDDHVYARSDSHSRQSVASRGQRTTRESEAVSDDAVGTGDSVSAHGTTVASESSVTESGGSTVRQADQVRWSVANAGDFDEAMTGVFASSGLEIVSAEFVDGLNLAAVRKDFGTGNDLSSVTLRGVVTAVRASHSQYVVLGTMDQELPDRDPVTGNVRVFVTVNAKVYDLSHAAPRVVAAVGPIQQAGMGPSPGVARVNALKLAGDDVARQLVDKISIKGVR